LLYLAGFLIVTSPLIIRNVIVYHHPFYNDNTTMLWIDDPKEFLSLETAESPPTAFSYLHNNSLGHLIGRTYNGFIGYLGVMIKDGLALSVLAAKLPLFKKISGSLMFLLMVIGGVLLGKRKINYFMLMHLLVFFFPATLVFHLIKPTRYLLPLLPFAWIYASIGIVGLAEIFQKKLSGRHVRFKVIPVLSMAACSLLIIYSVKLLISVPGQKIQVYRVPPGFQAVAEWAKENIKENEVYLAPLLLYHFELFTPEIKEPDLTYPFPIAKIFLKLPKKGRYFLPFTDDLDKLQSYLKRFNASYVIISALEIHFIPNALNEYLSIDMHKGFIHKKPIPGWVPVYSDPQNPLVRIYAIQSQTQS
jgi:hypothetical protein